MPKANITSTLSLQKQLSALGLADAWDQEVADFSGASGKSKRKLHLGGVLHWASLELGAGAGKQDEEPVEEKMDRPKMFYADHPFIILVRDNASGALLMMGALDHAEGEVLHDEL
uniref:Serpin peptidase inhibitor, clade H (Heat shock protein 47), member 1, (Collagen binding protein 1) n=2 Tax=Nothobranchius korthausae TaxID=1143690 RepID=A0A1A8ENM5_9TELE